MTVVIFLLAINLMKEGARDLAPLVRDQFAVDNPANSLGFGWLFSYVIMSGSPVAAAAPVSSSSSSVSSTFCAAAAGLIA